MQGRVKKLIKNGQFEITMGGWVGTDECTANYADIIMNFQIGHRWLESEFGVRPRVGWNIDPFGHTEANAAIFADLGFEALFFARIGQKEMNERFDPRNEGSHFLWQPMSKHFGD